MKKSQFVSILMCQAAVVCLASMNATATGITLQPDETASKDTWVYSFLAGTNMNTFPNSVALAAGNSFPVGPPGGEVEHDLNTLIQFDLSAVPYSSASVSSATLNLYVVPSEPFNGNVASPTAAKSVDVAVHAITGGWTEGAVTWSSKPTFNPAIEASTTISGVNQWITLDVTNLVKGWLTSPASNNGILLEQTNIQVTGQLFHIAAFYSSSAVSFADFTTPLPEFRLFLTVVPEPSGGVLAAIGFAGLGALRRRKRLC